MKTISDLLALALDKEIQVKLKGQANVKSDWNTIVEKAYTGNRNIKGRDNGVYRDEIFERDRINAQRAAGHSRPVYIKNDVLFVEADHQGWIQILQTMRKKIIETVNREYPGLSVRAIVFLLVNDANLAAPSDMKTGNETEVKESGKINEESYKNIKDERLKKVLMRLESRINTVKK